jgi:hypothetical protein
MVLWDEREDSPHGGNFWVDMTGFPNKPAALAFEDQDFPASYHHRAAGVSYADGRAEVHRWVDARTMPPIQKGKSRRGPSDPWISVPSAYNRDIMWLQERATRKIN